MRTSIILAIGSLAAIGAATTLAACSDPCGELEDTCATCSAASKSICDAVVNAGDKDACSSSKDTYASLCTPSGTGGHGTGGTGTGGHATGGTGTGGTGSCIQPGQTCQIAGTPCCSPGTCNSSSVCCNAVGNSCSQPSDCCAPTTCLNNSCVVCSDTGNGCSDTLPCCTGTCSGNVCG
jgi:hypothetical protein